MEDLLLQMSRIKKKISNSHGCSYLYSYFDELVKSLEAKGTDGLSDTENVELQELIESYARESVYNNFASAEWMMYSTRSFYCADYLVRYLSPQNVRRNMEHFLSLYFLDLVKSGVASIIQRDSLDKYMSKMIETSEAKDLYDTLVRKAVDECSKSRYWCENEVSLACSYTESIERLIKEYIEKYSDDSILKKWIPIIDTTRLVRYWYDYPNSNNYKYSGQYERECVMSSLDKMLDIHLRLFDGWFSRNPMEVVETLSQNDMIEILEVVEDDEFRKILAQIVAMPWNKKVESVLKHFVNDNEQWVVNLSRQLLATYENKR